MTPRAHTAFPGAPRAPGGAGGRSTPDGQHICLLFRDDEERDQDLARFLSAGLARGHSLLYIADARTTDDVLRRYRDLGVPFGGPSCAAEAQTTAEAFFPDGRFLPERMLAGLEARCHAAVRDGFAGHRCSGEMGWAARGVPGAERLIEYEHDLNAVIARNPFWGVCQYDVRLFDGATILAILEAHPYLLVRGQVLHNPNHVRRSALQLGERAGDVRAHL